VAAETIRRRRRRARRGVVVGGRTRGAGAPIHGQSGRRPGDRSNRGGHTRGTSVPDERVPARPVRWFSPDGRYVAYTSNESGREAVYVRPPRPGRAGDGVGGRWVAAGVGAERRLLRGAEAPRARELSPDKGRPRQSWKIVESGRSSRRTVANVSVNTHRGIRRGVPGARTTARRGHLAVGPSAPA
jgi:hypothetical protein